MPLEAKANVKLDGQEIKIAVQLLIRESKKQRYSAQESQQFIIIAGKLEEAREEFHNGWKEIMSEKYNLDKNKDAALTAP